MRWAGAAAAGSLRARKQGHEAGGETGKGPRRSDGQASRHGRTPMTTRVRPRASTQTTARTHMRRRARTPREAPIWQQVPETPDAGHPPGKRQVPGTSRRVRPAPRGPSALAETVGASEATSKTRQANRAIVLRCFGWQDLGMGLGRNLGWLLLHSGQRKEKSVKKKSAYRKKGEAYASR
ncbi:hypothetical protein CDD83_6055 [Cordyceps sp. RAO-2017]|nr:hypothetical protein CDD83_6055 [Cordyceps sp. RAO-2017]